MKKLLAVLFVAASMIGVAHAQNNTTITQDTANTAKATCLSNGGTAEECQAAYDAYIQAAGTTVPNTPAVQTPQPSSGSGFTALAPIPGLTDAQTTSVLDGNTLAKFFNNLYKYLIGLAATLAVIEIIWAGLEISFFQKDSVSAIVDNKGRIYNAIFGLILVLSPYLVFSIINPSILNLSLNLPKIVLDIPAGGSGGSGGVTPVVDPTTGCSVSGTSGILQFASCPSSASADAWGQSCSGNLSTGDSVTKADGTVISVMKMCSGSQKYIFIDLGTSALTGAMTRLQPLAITTDNPNNASSAMQFASICQSINLGLETCVSDAPVFTFATDCLPTPKTTMPPGTTVPAKCYKETLTCERILGSSQKCSSGPSWSPFQ